MKGLYRCIFAFFLTFVFFTTTAQTNGDYQSRQSGNWNTVATWQVFDGGSWVNLESSATYANVIPSSASGLISIQANTSVTVNTMSVFVDQLTVAGDGVLNIASGGELIVENGVGNDLTIATETTVVEPDIEELMLTFPSTVTIVEELVLILNLDAPDMIKSPLINVGLLVTVVSDTAFTAPVDMFEVFLISKLLLTVVNPGLLPMTSVLFVV